VAETTAGTLFAAETMGTAGISPEDIAAESCQLLMQELMMVRCSRPILFFLARSRSLTVFVLFVTKRTKFKQFDSTIRISLVDRVITEY
jgi:hypothetical protein